MTDPYNQTAQFTYGASQVAGRWCVSGINVYGLGAGTTGGVKTIQYSYADGQHLTGVTLADGSASTFTYGTSGIFSTVQFDDAAADEGHRQKTAYFSNNVVIDDIHDTSGANLWVTQVYNQSALDAPPLGDRHGQPLGTGLRGPGRAERGRSGPSQHPRDLHGGRRAEGGAGGMGRAVLPGQLDLGKRGKRGYRRQRFDGVDLCGPGGLERRRPLPRHAGQDPGRARAGVQLRLRRRHLHDQRDLQRRQQGDLGVQPVQRGDPLPGPLGPRDQVLL